MNDLPLGQKDGSGERRHELEPLLNRFPILEGAESATWLSGTLGTSDIPAPSIYWIDAVIVLPTAEHAALAAAGQLEPGSLPDDFSPDLVDSIPEGRIHTSSELHALFTFDRFISQALLVDDGVTLILTTKFD